MRVSWLNQQQRLIVEERARAEGFCCYFCQSPEPAARSEGEAAMGGSVQVVVECAECGDGTGIVRFSAQEVEDLLSLDHNLNLPYFPEADGSGRAPRSR